MERMEWNQWADLGGDEKEGLILAVLGKVRDGWPQANVS
jgi:hypothetical protein